MFIFIYLKGRGTEVLATGSGLGWAAVRSQYSLWVAETQTLEPASAGCVDRKLIEKQNKLRLKPAFRSGVQGFQAVTAPATPQPLPLLTFSLKGKILPSASLSPQNGPQQMPLDSHFLEASPGTFPGCVLEGSCVATSQELKPGNPMSEVDMPSLTAHQTLTLQASFLIFHHEILWHIPSPVSQWLWLGSTPQHPDTSVQL